MIRLLNIFLFTFLATLLFSVDSYAILKIDAPESVTKVIDIATDVSQEVRESQFTSGVQDIIHTMGKGVAEAKAMKLEIEKNAQLIGSSVDQIKSNIDAVQDVVSNPLGAISDNAGVKELEELNALKKEKKSIEAEYDQALSSISAEYDVLLSSVDENISVISINLSSQDLTIEERSKYENSISALQEQKQSISAENQEIANVLKAERDAILSDINEEISAKETELKGVLSHVVKEKTDGIVTKDDIADAMLDVQNKFYIKPGTAENAASVFPIKRQREKEALSRIVSATHVFLTEALKSGDKMDFVTDMADSNKGLEGYTSIVSMNIDLTIEEMSTLLSYNKLLLAKIKLDSSLDALRNSSYSVEGSDRDITEFNFDDYIIKTGQSKDGE